MGKIAVLVMACNEPDELRRCLASVPAAWPKFVSVDVKTTDDTEALARELATAVQTHEFLNNSWADTRNAVMEWAEGLTDADWFLWLDADEWLDANAEALPRYVDEADAEGCPAVSVTLIDYMSDERGKRYAASEWINAKVLRRGQRYERRRHETIAASVPRIMRPDVVIRHAKTQRPEVIAACQALKHDLEAVLADFKEFPDQRSAFNVGSVCQKLGRLTEAVGWFTIGLALPKTQQDIHGMLLDGRAATYRAMGLPGLAKADALAKLQMGREEVAEAALDIALDCYNLGDVDGAEWWARTALSVPPTQRLCAATEHDKVKSVPWYVLALVEYARGHHADALAYLQKAMAMGPARSGYENLRRVIVKALAAELPEEEPERKEETADAVV